MSKFTIYPIRLGHSNIAASFVRRGSHVPGGSSATISFTHGCYAAKNNETGKVTLLDSGSGHWKWLEENNLIELGYKTNVEEGPTVVEALEKVGIKAEDVERICLTHLHHDHACNLWRFPADTPIYVQREEMYNAVAPYKSQQWDYTYLPHPALPYWKNNMTQMVPIDGDYEIEPGLKLLYTPGHTFGSQSIMVDTEDGWYVYVGDLFYVEDNMTEGVIHTNFCGVDVWHKSRNRIWKMAQEEGVKVLWLHDEKFFEKEAYGAKAE